MVPVNAIAPVKFVVMIPTRESYMAWTILLLFVFAVTATSADAASANNQLSIRYTDLGRTSFEEFTMPRNGDRGEWSAGNILPARPVGTQKTDVSMLGVTGVVTHNCSDTEFRCLYGAFHVFAVPRIGLAKASTYSVAGAVFHVDQCLRAIGERCQVALLSSQCLHQVGEDICRPAAGNEQSLPGPVMYFIFNEDFGVTSYGFATDILNAADDRIAVASKLMLQGDRGLLSE